MSDIEQRTPEWYAARLGKITASRISAVLAKPQGKKPSAATRDNYRAELLLERITGKEKADTYQSKAMERGIQLEPEARAAYDTRYSVMVEPVGFVLHPTIKNAGCSPDGFVGDEGIIQVKCPYPAHHIEWLTRGGLPSEHRPQVAFELACCREREWEDFVSYCPDFPEHLRLYVYRVYRTAMVDVIENIEREVVKLDAEVEEMIRLLPSDKSTMELLGASKEQAEERKAKLSGAIAAAREDSTQVTQDDVEFATGKQG